MHNARLQRGICCFFKESSTFSAMKKHGLFFFAAGILLILALYAINVFPIPGTDAAVYIPTALLYSKGHGMINPVYYFSKLLDPSGADKFDYYVPLHPLFLGWASKIRPGVKTIFLICWAINALSLVLYTRKISTWHQGQRPVVKLLGYLSFTYIAMYILPTAGRPECITMLLIMLLALIYSRRSAMPPVAYQVAVAALGGLMLSTQILSCFFCMLVLLTYELLETNRPWRAVGLNVLRFAGVVAVFLGITALSPNGLMDTLAGIAHHAGLAMARPDRSIPLFIHYWVLSPINFAFLGVFCVAAYYYIQELRERLRQKHSVIIVFVVLLQLLVAGGIVKFILYASPTVYNATQYIMPISAYIFYNLSKSNRPQLLAAATTGMVYIAGSFIFMRSLLLFADYLGDGKTYDDAQPVVEAILAKYPTVYMTHGLWALAEDQRKVKIYRPGVIQSGDIVIEQQAGHEPEPEIAAKGTIIIDWRTVGTRKIVGIPLTKRPQGYSFTVYQIK